MPYSDNLYSMVDDDSDIEQIGDATTQDGNTGLDVASRASQLHAHNAYAATQMDEEEGVGFGNVVDDEDPHALSPTDGYFGTATDTPSGTAVPTQSSVPYVPNVLVEDPSLQRSTAESKAREAEQERLRNEQPLETSDGGNTSASPSHDATAASQNGSSSAYGMAPAAHSIPSSSQSIGATYYSPSSSTYIRTVATSSSHTAYSTRRSAYDGEPFPFLPREAPPAYTPSPISPSDASGFGPSRNYRTFSQATDTISINMGQPEETQGLLAHQPESMRDHYPDGLDETPATWRDRTRRIRLHANWGCCKIALIAVLLLLLTTGFLSSLFTGTKSRTGPHDPAADKPQTRPGEPNMSYPEIDDGFSWDAASFCKDTQIHRHVQSYDFSFDANRELVLVEKTTEDDGRRGWGEVHTQGAVILRRAGPGAADSAVTVETTVTDERLKVLIKWDGEIGKLKIIVPHRVEWSPDKPRACVNVKVTVWVPENSELERLTVDAVHLDIKLLDNLSLSVRDFSKLVSTVGSVTAASTGTSSRDDQLIDLGAPESFRFKSRSIVVKTTASPIKGSWPLYDNLSLQSAAGDIRVCVEPKEADPNSPSPAALSIKSLSGDAEFREPILAAEHSVRMSQAFPSLPDPHLAQRKAESFLPPRDYRVDVQTTSGDITGAVAFSSWASFKSTSGTVSLDLLPVLNSSLAGQTGKEGDVELRTYSTSGATDVRVLDPVWVDVSASASASASDEPVQEMGDKKKGGRAKPRHVVLKSSSPSAFGSEGAELRCLYSTHTTTSANIKLRYPESWEGDINLSSLTGFLQVGGDGVKLIKAGSDWPGVNKNMLARKGEKGNGGTLVGKSTSGGVDVFVGRR
ncbi:hypothetical protein C8A03DRAFT_16913 [Achaetomium macrosporum]|uniref:Uncharacterized protein n=1 Tax=Achaetomium macrosporum TaxID=79813 RepID=A0AAN7C6R0_9PEZI|nr:hypothetical protein C8A03DRAFT_16913 [Achaetomium macrosporum]